MVQYLLKTQFRSHWDSGKALVVMGPEIDYLEEQNGILRAWEFKWNLRIKARFPKTRLKAYGPLQTEVIQRDNVEGLA